MQPLMLTFFIALWAGRAFGATCDTAAPMALPITDVIVDPSIPGSFMRGVPAKIGTPPQDIVVMPWPDLNNTYIYDEEAFCDKTVIFSDTICAVRRGGLFQDAESTSFSKSSDLIAAGGAARELGNVRGAELGVAKLLSTSVGGTERFAIAPANTTTMPIGIPRMRWDHGYTILHALGLGANSTYLNSLVQAGQIPSRVWSIFWGRMWTDNESTNLDGSLVLGGYDQEKVIGKNVTQRLDYSEETGCWTGMKVTVSNLLVNFRNGTDFSVMPRDSAVQCCIVPQRQLLWEGPSDMVGTFISATQMNNTGLSFGMHWGAQQFDASDPRLFDGDATFVLSNGLSVRVPNSQLMTPFVAVDRNGSRIVDRSKRELLFSGVGDNPTTLGRYFFTAAYLMVDHDAETFTMWQANPSSRTNLVPVVSKAGDEGGCEEGGGANGDGGSAGGNGAEGGQGGGGDGGGGGANASTDEATASSVNAGAIAGGVVGGVAALAALAVLVFFLLRRRKRQDSANPPPLPEMASPAGGYTGGADGVYYYKTNRSGLQEAPGAELSPGELHGVSASSYGGATWAITANGMPPESRVTYEMDGGGVPRDYTSQGYPRFHSD
ncbi:aspartic peptidase domain-containing protein [Chaetomium fimeti]|uniref:Aspartic peptidase domain-containing protein n=1 Tax=Chaetomium fimeti TaxID=1854472 RepID=A0AAE0HBZ7_9PEZI|nr:aspartic peptidase domain-containing protein [Chaetomium fimeti]